MARSIYEPLLRAQRRIEQGKAIDNVWKKVLGCTALLCLSGCALVWGQAYHVEFANSTSVTIEFDRVLTDMGNVQNVAQASCSQYGKDAVPASWSSAALGGMRDATFLCVSRHT